MTTHDPSNISDDEDTPPVGAIPEPRAYPAWIFDDPRWHIDPETGTPCVRSVPGAPKVTLEDIKKELEDFP